MNTALFDKWQDDTEKASRLREEIKALEFRASSIAGEKPDITAAQNELERLQNEKYSLLADVSLGLKDQEELTGFEDGLKDAQYRLEETQKRLVHHEGLMKGVNARLEEKRAQLRNQEAQAEKSRRAYAMEQVEASANEYFESIKNVTSSFSKLKRLMKDAGLYREIGMENFDFPKIFLLGNERNKEIEKAIFQAKIS